jgi:HK97 family phage major capsid protein
MAYTNVISRSDAVGLIPEDVTDEIIKNVSTESAALSLFRRVTMSSNQYRMPVLAALPTAYFVNGDTGLKQTTEAAWANKFLFAEEIAAIVPIPEAVLDDVAYDLWGEIRPLLEEAIARTLDAAIFFGTNKPSSWPVEVVTSATSAGNTYNRGTNAAAAGGIAEDINQVMGLVEADGFAVDGFVTRTTYKTRLRGARDTTGQLLMDLSQIPNTIWGEPVQYVMPGMWPTGSGSAELFAGDFSQGILAVRRDMTYKVLDQAVIQNDVGDIIYNLPQQDMVALRVVARYAWQVPNPINYEQQTDASRYPFAVLKAP